MLKYLFYITLIIGFISFVNPKPKLQLIKEVTIDSLGGCQGISYQNGNVFLYGDREVGIIRKFKLAGDSLLYQHEEYKLTINNNDLINHPTGFAYHPGLPTFIGNSVRMDPAGKHWKAVIYNLNWLGLQQTKTLDGNLLNTIDDDACIQGTRPQYVKYHGKWLVATADYGDNGNEVRLYDPIALARCKKTSEKGVLYAKFPCTPWVQNLYWIAKKGILVLIQNQIEGSKWRFTFVDLAKSVGAGKMIVIKESDVNSRLDELEGFSLLDNANDGIAVTSSRKNNVNLVQLTW